MNSAQTNLLIVPEAVWWEIRNTPGGNTHSGWRHGVDIEGGDEQSFVLFVTDQHGRIIPHKDRNEPVGELDYDHWAVKVIVSSDNAQGFEGTIGFTLTRNSLAPDQPAFTKQRNVKPRLRSK